VKPNQLVWALLLAGMAAVRLPAQTLQTLFSFSGGTNGEYPQAGLTLGNDGNFYGTTSFGGISNYGTVFKVTTNGSLTTLVSFEGTNGTYPHTALTLGDDDNFYGMTWVGGSSGDGTLFKVTTNGVLTTLVSFGNTNGADPWDDGLTLGGDGNFYGMTDEGGGNGVGTIFQVTTNGTLTTLVSFAGTNGANPYAILTLGNDGNFYGTTYTEGANVFYGTVFKVTTNGTLTTLVSFTNTNGANPYAGLTLGNDGNFYGTTWGGGSSGEGTVFEITTNGALTTLVSFNGTNGDYPQAALTLGNDGNFYGTTQKGDGTIFQVTTNGTLTTLYSFTGDSDGTFPQGALTLGNDGNFYGTTEEGGSKHYGTVFRLLLPPVINAPVMLANGQFQFSFKTATRVDYEVDYSTNLTQWFPLVTLGGIGEPLTVIDPNASGSQQRFYRIILSPQ
jgi:uncharacterized repeat protein (TIGR03803 family)